MPNNNNVTREAARDDAIPLRYLKELPLSPKPVSGELKRSLDELVNENDNLHNQLFAERQQSLSIKCDLEQTRERVCELQCLLRQAQEDKAQIEAKLQQHDQDATKWIEHRVLLTKACEDLQTKTSKMEEIWKARSHNWEEAKLAYENRIRDLAERLTETNRQLRARCNSNYHKRALEDAMEQIQRLKQRLRSEQFGRVCESVLVAERPGACTNTTASEEDIEALGMRHENLRLTTTVHTLEEQIAEKNRELHNIKDQLSEVQSLLRDNLERQSRAAHDSKSLNDAVQNLHAKVEEQVEEISNYQNQIRSLGVDLANERANNSALLSKMDLAQVERDRSAKYTAALQQKLEEANAFKKAIVEIAAERDDLRSRLQQAESDRDKLRSQNESLQSDNSMLRKELQNLVDTVSNHERQLAAQADWYKRWKTDIDSVSGDLRQEADRLQHLRQLEAAEIRDLKRQLSEAQDALKQAQEKNARMDSVLERVIATC